MISSHTHQQNVRMCPQEKEKNENVFLHHISTKSKRRDTPLTSLNATQTQRRLPLAPLAASVLEPARGRS